MFQSTATGPQAAAGSVTAPALFGGGRRRRWFFASGAGGGAAAAAAASAGGSTALALALLEGTGMGPWVGRERMQSW